MQRYIHLFLVIIALFIKPQLVIAQTLDKASQPPSKPASPVESNTDENITTAPEEDTFKNDFFFDEIETAITPPEEEAIKKTEADALSQTETQQDRKTPDPVNMLQQQPAFASEGITETEYEKKLKKYRLTIKEEDFTKAAKLQALNKITARAHVLHVKLNETAKFGNLSIILNRCWKAPQTQIPESKALLFIQETVPGEETRTVFEGWMFASSPSLSALEHPVYDVRVLECSNGENVVQTEATLPQSDQDNL